MDEALAYFLDLRVKLCGNPEARSVVDRCIALIAAAGTADGARLAELELEVETLRADLEARFGRKAAISVH